MFCQSGLHTLLCAVGLLQEPSQGCILARLWAQGHICPGLEKSQPLYIMATPRQVSSSDYEVLLGGKTQEAVCGSFLSSVLLMPEACGRWGTGHVPCPAHGPGSLDEQWGLPSHPPHHIILGHLQPWETCSAAGCPLPIATSLSNTTSFQVIPALGCASLESTVVLGQSDLHWYPPPQQHIPFSAAGLAPRTQHPHPLGPAVLTQLDPFLSHPQRFLRIPTGETVPDMCRQPGQPDLPLHAFLQEAAEHHVAPRRPNAQQLQPLLAQRAAGGQGPPKARLAERVTAGHGHRLPEEEEAGGAAQHVQVPAPGPEGLPGEALPPGWGGRAGGPAAHGSSCSRRGELPLGLVVSAHAGHRRVPAH